MAWSDLFSGWGDSWLGKAYDWASKNSDDIGQAVDFGRKAFNLFDVNDARQQSRGDILDVMTRMQAEDDAYAKQMWEYQNAQRASAAAAARQNDANRRAAAKKAMKAQQKGLKELINKYQPYTDTMKTLLPKMTQNYGQFLDSTAMLNQYLAPMAMKTLGEKPKPSFEQQIPQSAYMAGSVQGAPVSFPSLDEVLGVKR